MCDKKAVKATAAKAAEVRDNDFFIVIRDVTPEALHLKGVYETLEAADARVAEFEAAGRTACIVAVPGDVVGDCDREVLSVEARTIKVVTSA